jgi:hypothetical protein
MSGADWARLGHPHTCNRLFSVCVGSAAGYLCEEPAQKAAARLERLRIERVGLTAGIELAVTELLGGDPPVDVADRLRRRLDPLGALAPVGYRPDTPWRPAPTVEPDPLGLRGLSKQAAELLEKGDRWYEQSVWWREDAELAVAA